MVLCQDEYLLFVEVLEQWLTDHPEFQRAEDMDDVHQIAMSIVLELRILELIWHFGSTPQLERARDQAGRQKQIARERLGATRRQRVAEADARLQINWFGT
jgi:hypothetical protein